jgi:hypothetical protein
MFMNQLSETNLKVPPRISQHPVNSTDRTALVRRTLPFVGRFLLSAGKHADQDLAPTCLKCERLLNVLVCLDWLQGDGALTDPSDRRLVGKRGRTGGSNGLLCTGRVAVCSFDPWNVLSRHVGPDGAYGAGNRDRNVVATSCQYA